MPPAVVPMANLSIMTKKKKGISKVQKTKKNTKTTKGKNKPKKPKNNTILRLTEVDYTRVKDPLKLQEFIIFLATPKVIREEENQGKLAKRLEVGEDTLSDWKHLDHFWDEVVKFRKNAFKSKSTEVMQGLYMKARLGGAKEVELFFKLNEDWSDKIRTEDETPETPLEETQRAKIEKALRNWGDDVKK